MNPAHVCFQGYTIPAGDQLMLSPYWNHRNPELFPDPEAFNPVTCVLKRDHLEIIYEGGGGGGEFDFCIPLWHFGQICPPPPALSQIWFPPGIWSKSGLLKSAHQHPHTHTIWTF